MPATYVSKNNNNISNSLAHEKCKEFADTRQLYVTKYYNLGYPAHSHKRKVEH